MLIKPPSKLPSSSPYTHFSSFATSLSSIKPMKNTKKTKQNKPTKIIRKITSTKSNKDTNDPSKSTIIEVKPKRKRKVDAQTHHYNDSICSASDDASLSLFLETWPILPPDFYQIDALELAPRLLGKFLRKDDVVLQITEVEAYRPNDSACHGRFGITARTAPVFGPGGHAYVYLCYGLHIMLNIVGDKEGVGAAVLVRSCAPVSGLETIQQRRGLKTEKPVLLTGPGKVGQALGISTEWSNHPLFAPGGLEILDGPKPEQILVGPRVGIDYALPEHVSALWRFAVADTPWISAPKNTLRPP